MGEVYRASDARLDRDVALKILPRHFLADPLARQRFEREAKAIAALSHPNILSIFDFGEDDGRPFIVTELLDGETLRKRLGGGALPWRKAMEIAAGIADGLAAAHAKGITHRDLKPENIFLTDEGRVKILDFGLARHADDASPAIEGDIPTAELLQTGEGRVVGTLGYLAPEQLRGEEVDGRTDIFSLGCVMFEMLAGKNPFFHASGADTMSSILRDDPLERGFPSNTPPEIVHILRRCLEKRPQERFQSAHDLAFALRAMASGTLSSGATRLPVSERKLWIPVTIVLLLIALLVGGYFISRRPVHIRSIAVLPFDHQGESDDQYLADGLTESLIQSLSRLPNLSVMSATSVFQYKGKTLDMRAVGRDLKVDALLTGRIDHRGSNIYVNSELVEAKSGRHLWGKKYESTAADVVALHARIADDVAANLREGSGGARPPTASSVAYQEYLKGRFHWNKRTPDGFARAITHFQKAIEHDASYALAYAGLADSFILQALYGQVAPAPVLKKAREAATKALSIDPSLPEAHTSLAYLHRNADGDLLRSSDEFRKALALNPNYATAHHWYALCLADLGQIDDAIGEIEKAAAVDPLSPAIYADYAGILNDAGRSQEAITQIRKALEIDPDFPFAHHIYAEIHLALGNPAAAIAEATRSFELGRDPRVLLRLAQAYKAAGRASDARALLTRLEALSNERFVSPYVIARVAAVVGENDRALQWLRKGIGVLAAGAYARALDRDRLLDPLRNDPRFAALRAEVK